MSGEALYERYKDALRRGHVASLRGRLEEALTAYAEAAAIAPERATPHTSAGTALMRRKRPADAVRHYAAAIRLAPRDEAAVLGYAQALAAIDRRPEAADAYDAAAELLASNGKLADAVDAARRGLELAEGRERRRTLERLIERLKASDPGDRGRQALEQALVVLDGRAVEPGARVPPPRAAAPATSGARAAAPAPSPAEAPAVAAPVEPEPPVVVAPAEPEPPVVVAPAEPEVVPEPVRAVLDRDLPADLDLDALATAVDASVDERLDGGAIERVLDLAAAYRRVGRMDAALDACYLALAISPDDLGLHLALVELYDERGWTSLADEKLALLDRLSAFDEAGTAAARVGAARAARD